MITSTQITFDCKQILHNVSKFASEHEHFLLPNLDKLCCIHIILSTRLSILFSIHYYLTNHFNKVGILKRRHSSRNKSLTHMPGNYVNTHSHPTLTLKFSYVV